MNCAEAETLIAARLDGELDVPQQRAVDAHIAGCPGCAAELASLTDLKTCIAADASYHRAPAALHLDVGRLLADAQRPRHRLIGWLDVMPGRRAFTAGALAGALLLALGWIGATAWLQRLHTDDLTQQLVDAHVRATLDDRLVAVVSTDQHTVKPWLSARLDYSPPIVETPIEGVTLVGARVESIGGRRVAALVYRYRQHVVDVFVEPAEAPVGATAPTTIRGFNVAEASGAGMQWRGVSDVSMSTLRPLVDALAHPPPLRD